MIEDFPRKRKIKNEISMIPVINLVFLLLIFFMVTGTMEQPEIVPIELPEAKSGKVLDEGKVVIILGQHGEVLVNDDLTDMASLRLTLPERIKQTPNAVVSLKADVEVPAHQAIEVMELVRKAGGQNLSLVTQGMAQ